MSETAQTTDISEDERIASALSRIEKALDRILDMVEEDEDRLELRPSNPFAIVSTKYTHVVGDPAGDHRETEAMVGTLAHARFWIAEERARRHDAGEKQLLHAVLDFRIPEKFRLPLLEVHADGTEHTPADWPAEVDKFAELETV